MYFFSETKTFLEYITRLFCAESIQVLAKKMRDKTVLAF